MANFQRYVYYIMIFVFMVVCSEETFPGDNDKYLKFAALVKDFDTTGYSLIRGADHEINIKNSAGNILKFRVSGKNELMSYHCGIVFIYFEFNDGWLQRYTTLDKDGVLKGDDEFGDLAAVEYEIRKMNLLHAKFEVLNEADGNIQMNDAKDEIVYMRAYDSKNKLIKENYISSKEYWNANNVLYGP